MINTGTKKKRNDQFPIQCQRFDKGWQGDGKKEYKGNTSMEHFIEATLLGLLTRRLTRRLTLYSVISSGCSGKAQGVLRARSDLLSEPKAARTEH